MLWMIVAAAAQPDLVATQIAGPATATAGSQISLTVVVDNDGPTDAGARIDYFRVSSDPYYNPSSDAFLCSASRPALAAGATDSYSPSNCIIPSGLTGPYHVVYSVDATSAVAESEELANNFGGTSIDLTGAAVADIRLENVAVPAAATEGELIQIAYDVVNDGAVTAGAHTTRIRLSVDALYDSLDPIMCDHAVPAVPANASISVTASCGIPGGTSDGAYFVVLNGDALDDVPESDQGNNRGNAPIDVVTLSQVDLNLVAAEVDAQVEAGSDLQLEYTLENMGSATATASTTRVVLSTDEVVTADDVVLCSDPVTGLFSGASSIRSVANCSVPLSTLRGDWFALVTVDADDVLDETNESNNALSVAFEVIEPASDDKRDTGTDASDADKDTADGEPTPDTEDTPSTGASDTGDRDFGAPVLEGDDYDNIGCATIPNGAASLWLLGLTALIRRGNLRNK